VPLWHLLRPNLDLHWLIESRHCSAVVCVFSAGVGRTGVLIGMLTAWSYIEAGIAVDMLSIVQQMRDQRAVLIQTSVSDAVFTNTPHCAQHECTTVYTVYVKCHYNLCFHNNNNNNAAVYMTWVYNSVRNMVYNSIHNFSLHCTASSYYY